MLLSCHAQVLHIFGTFHRNLYKIWRIVKKFCADSMKIPESFCAANHGVEVLVPWGVSPISAEWYFVGWWFVLTQLTSSFFVECLHSIWTLYTLAQLSCVRCTTVAKIEVLTCSLQYLSSSSDRASPKYCQHAQQDCPRDPHKYVHRCTLSMRCLRRSTATYSTATMIPPFQLLQADYPSTILYDDSIVIILRDSVDAFENSDCADALLQIHRYPLMILQIPFDDSANSFSQFRELPLTISRVS